MDKNIKNNGTESFSKVSISWFPGHMQKAIREIKEKISLIDVVYLIVDARIPYSSSIPNIKEIVGNKPILYLLNKASLADPIMTKKWINHYEAEGFYALDIDAITGYNLNKIESKTKEILKEKIEAKLKKGLKTVITRAIIVGIPNSGKSTLINKISKRRAAQVGDKPGITKAQQWIKVGNGLELLDTPGILWPKFDNSIGINLGITGAIKDEVLPLDVIANEAIIFLDKYYPNLLKKRYQIEYDNFDLEIFYKEVSVKRGCLLNGDIDYNRINRLILKDLRDNLIGRITIDQNV